MKSRKSHKRISNQKKKSNKNNIYVYLAIALGISIYISISFIQLKLLEAGMLNYTSIILPLEPFKQYILKTTISQIRKSI